MKIAVAVFVINDNEFLMQHRLSSHGAGTWSVPGGKLNKNESLEECAIREVFEETDLIIKNVEYLTTSIEDDWSTHWMVSDFNGGYNRNMEPDKCLAQRWVTLDTLPYPLFEPFWGNLFNSKEFLILKNRLNS